MIRALPVVVVLTSACGVQVIGDFDGVPFTPDATILAYADRHELLVRDGAVLPVKKNTAAQRIDVLLTAARVDITEDWRTLPADDLLEIRRDLATSDGLLLQDVPLSDFAHGDTLRAVVKNGAVDGDFVVAVGQALPPAERVADQGLGARVTVTITPGDVDVQPHGGSMSAQVEVKREREAGQGGEVATGTVTLSFGTDLYAERLSDANFGVAAPILLCMQDQGPNRAGACRDAEPRPIVDETGTQP